MKHNFLVMICLGFMIQVSAQKISRQDSIAAEAAKLESWVPVPVITPGKFNNEAPSDAIILFNGKDLSAFQKKNKDIPKITNTTPI